MGEVRRTRALSALTAVVLTVSMLAFGQGAARAETVPDPGEMSAVTPTPTQLALDPSQDPAQESVVADGSAPLPPTTSPVPRTAPDTARQVDADLATTAGFDEGTGSIAGTLTIPAGTVWNEFGGGVGVYVEGVEDQELYGFAPAGGDGTYQVTGLPAGTFTVRFSPQGINTVQRWWHGARTVGSAQTITLADGEQRTGVDDILPKGGTISGRVTNVGGDGVADVYVSADTDANDYGGATTASDGTYTIYSLEAGQYRLRFDPPSDSGLMFEYWNDTRDRDAATLVAVAAGGTVTGRDAVLAAGATVSGTVTGPGGAVLADARVALYSSRSTYSEVASAYTNEDGTYRVGAVPAGTYYLGVSGPWDSDLMTEYWNDSLTIATSTAITLTTAQQRTGVNVQLARGATISGKVTGPTGEPLEEAEVSAIVTTSWGTSSVAYDWTASDGTFALRGLSPDSYTLRFSAPDGIDALDEYWRDAVSVDEATFFTVAAGATVTGMNAQLAKPSTLQGTLTNLGGAPVAGADLEIERRVGDESRSWNTATSGSDGRFSVTGLAAGTYRVSVFYGAMSSVASVVVGAGATVTKDISFSTGNTITGTVRDASGAGVATTVWATDRSGMGIASGHSDSSGAYRIVGVPDGRYTLQYSQGDHSWFLGGGALLLTATFATITGNATVVLDTRAAGASVSGTISAANAPAGVADARIRLLAKNGRIVGDVETDAAGRYRVSGVAPGTYSLRVTASGYVEKWGDGTSLADATFFTVGATDVVRNATLTTGARVTGLYRTSTSVFLVPFPVDPINVERQAWAEDGVGFAFEAVVPGTYLLRLGYDGESTSQWYGGGTDVSKATRITVTEGQTLALGDVTPSTATGRLTVKVTVPAGTDLSSAYVSASGDQYASADFDGAASTTLRPLQVGSYVVEVRGIPGYAPITTQVTLTGDQTVTLTPIALTGSLKGSVKVGTAAVAGASVYLYSGDAWVDDTITDAAGAYDFGTVLVAGRSYTLSVYKTGYSDSPVTFVATAGAQTKNLTVSTAGRISGVVTDRVAGGGASLRVAAMSADTYYETSTRTDGSYTFTDLRPGSYAVRFGFYSSGYGTTDGYYAPEWLGGTVVESGATRLEVGAGSNITAPAAQVEQGALISGQVGRKVGAATRWIGGARVTLYSATGQLLDDARTSTITPGTYAFLAKAGSYKVCATNGVVSWRNETLPGGCWTATVPSSSISPAQGDAITTVRGAERADVDIVFGATPPAAIAFTAAPVPTIPGTAKFGSTLTAVPGTWSPTASLAYQWYADGAAIAGATASTFAPTAAHVGAVITVAVTGSKSGYLTTTKTSAPTAKVAAAGTVSGVTPTISGTAKVGVKLTAKPGTWTSGATLAYQWSAAGTPVSGATASTFTPTAAQVGKTITVTVRGSKPGYAAASKASKATAKVAAGTLTAPVPTISGTAKVGVKLTAKPGTWTSGTAFSYQWYAGGKAISKATASTFTPTASQSGKTITVKVTGKKPGYTSVSKTSKATKKVAAGTLTAPVPAISGTAKVGAKLTAKPGTWTSGTALSYQWYASGKAISKATKTTFTPTASQSGKTITVKVTGKKTGYTTTAKTSKATAKVAAGTLTAPVPTISGTAKVGVKLTAKPGTWTSGTALTYQWYADGKAISKATKSTFTVTTTQKGKAITVKVTGKKSGYATVAKTSLPTALAV